jgi:hypothetical protein
MKTNVINALAVLSVVLLLAFTIASSATSRNRAAGGWQSVGVSAKDNAPMADGGMPGRR